MTGTLLKETLKNLIADTKLSHDSRLILTQLQSRLDGLTPKQDSDAYRLLFKLKQVVSIPHLSADIQTSCCDELTTFLNTLDSVPVQDTQKEEDSNKVLLGRLIEMLDEEKLKLLNKKENNHAYGALHDYCAVVLNDLKCMPRMDPHYFESDHFKNLEIESKKMRGTGLENLCLLIKNFFILLSKGEKPTFEKLSLTTTAKDCERIKASAQQFFSAAEEQQKVEPSQEEKKLFGLD